MLSYHICAIYLQIIYVTLDNKTNLKCQFLRNTTIWKSGIWGCQKNLNIEKIAFKVVQIKFLAIHINYKKLSFDIFTLVNLQNIFMEHFWHKSKNDNFDPYFCLLLQILPQWLKTGFVVQGHISQLQNVSGYVCNHGSPSGERDTASPRGHYGERPQRDSVWRYICKNTTCWPATAHDVTTGVPQYKCRRENTSSASSSEACVRSMARILGDAVRSPLGEPWLHT